MKYWYKHKDYWYLGFPYNEQLVREVKTFPNAGYNPENKEWYIPFFLPFVAKFNSWIARNGFVNHRETFVSKRFKDYIPPEEIISAEEVMEACKHLKFARLPRYYQCEGVAYMINHGSCINGDSCGLGKTGQTIIAVELLDDFPALVITPASVKYNWAKEWKKWNPKRSVGVIDSKQKDDKVWNNDVIVINYDILGVRGEKKTKSKFAQLTRKKWKANIYDEIHFLKSKKALRTKMAKKISAKVAHVWGLTGTFIQNKPADIIEPFTIIHKFEEIFESSTAFRYRYCDGKRTRFGFDSEGNSNLSELNKFLCKSAYIHRSKRDVLDELPPIIEQVVDVTIDNMKDYSKAENNLISYLHSIDVSKAQNAANAPHIVMIQTLRKLSIDGKLEFIAKYIDDWCVANEGESLVVFGVHREPLQLLAKAFDTVVIQGGVSSEQKFNIVQDFCKGKYRILFINIQSGGTGVDGLQEVCSNLFYIELPDKSTEIEQVNSRLERMGQKNCINITYLLSPDTIDTTIYDMVANKNMITSIVNRGLTPEEVLLQKFLGK